MKRYCICWVLIIAVMLSLCACAKEEQIIDGETVDVLTDKFAIIEEYSPYNYIVYDINTNVVYYFDFDSYGGFLTPYQIYEDGVIYGAVYENGEIVSKPYALGITFEMLGLASKYLN